jgi:NAD(P)-dependent dehydrogenase (short-subunit alcohol dehydrogenase family)
MGSIETMKMEDYEETMEINVSSVIKLTQLCVPHLIAQKGAIVNVSSVTGTRSFPGVLAYCMSKAALDQFTKCIALGIGFASLYRTKSLLKVDILYLISFIKIELADKGVRVNAVNPGVIVTNIHKRAGQNDENYAKVVATIDLKIFRFKPIFLFFLLVFDYYSSWSILRQLMLLVELASPKK